MMFVSFSFTKKKRGRDEVSYKGYYQNRYLFKWWRRSREIEKAVLTRKPFNFVNVICDSAWTSGQLFSLKCCYKMEMLNRQLCVFLFISMYGLDDSENYSTIIS